MRRYLWAGVIAMTVCVNASDNPFDLKENFGKIDQDQEVLLSALKKLSQEKEVEEEKKSISTDPSPVVKTLEKESTQRREAFADKTDEVEERLNQIREKAMSEDALRYQNEEQTKTEEAVDSEKIKEAQLEEERREVEEYERRRARKLALKEKEEAEKKAIAQQKALEKRRAEALAKEEAEKEKAAEKKAIAQQKALEKRRAEALEKEEAEKEKAAMAAQKSKAAEKKAKKNNGIVDINITREQNEAKEAAELAYMEAVKEMSQEEE